MLSKLAVADFVPRRCRNVAFGSLSTATEALAALPRCEADILVSDIGLPDMDGYDLTATT